MPKFRKRPVVIEAVQFDGTNHDEIIAFMSGQVIPGGASGLLAIETLEGTMQVTPGDWVIQGVQGEFYPCKPDIFAATYEPESLCLR